MAELETNNMIGDPYGDDQTKRRVSAEPDRLTQEDTNNNKFIHAKYLHR
jgi:hypothetical protein